MTTCPKCGSPWRRQYTNEYVESQALDDRMQFKLMTQVICTRQECSHAWELDALEIVRHFAEGRAK